MALVLVIAGSVLSIGCNILPQAAESSTQASTRSGKSANAHITLPDANTSNHASSDTVDPCVRCVAIQISPANPTIAAGGKVQFAALVSNTSNTAVTWSASAGSISPTGLFQAPASTMAQPITVTASGLGNRAAAASTTVTITSGEFKITTWSVPAAVEAAPYSASLTASGGEPPYHWSVASGSLPAGLKLGATTGTLSGSSTQAGTFRFNVQGMDAASHTAHQSLSLAVSTSGKTCGPPAYNCSRTDVRIVPLPLTPPDVGNLVGANTIVTDPDFGNRVVRITDADTNLDAGFRNITFVATSSGSADDNLWNIDSTLFLVQDTGSGAYPFTFNPSTLQAARMYRSNFPATNGLRLPDGGDWSRVNANVLYTFDDTAIEKYDFTDRTNPPSPKAVYDFTSSRKCLPAGFTQTWRAKGGVNSDDTTFGMAYSDQGGQGTGTYVVAYKAGSGCSMLNTRTGQVQGDWGASGTINMPDRWTIHNAKLSKDGNWMVIATTGHCTSSHCSKGPYFWQIGTTNVVSCGNGGSCGGHWTEGYSHWENNDNSPISNQVIRAFADVKAVSDLTSDFPSGLAAPLDQHQSWNNVDPADSLPFFSTTCTTTRTFPAPWYNEIIAIAADGSGTTWRFAHSFITARSQTFSTENGIGAVSQDGKFFVFSSDWMGKLGSLNGSTTCRIGGDCRGDVFVVELR
ncbi:MAG TPA: putative Ig domain-containing protein [Candidatus Sulfotelmatobacter sp.]